jgi:Transposase DNA-binding/Transposase Tn5 dimerisation domain
MNTFLAHELRFADLGDQRLNQRLQRLVTALADKPAASVPHALGDWGQTKAAYRFWDNDRVDAADIRLAHRQATLARLPDTGTVLAIQDTTSFSFTGHKTVRGLGYLTKRYQRGLLVHSLLAASDTGVPLGVVHQEVWARTVQRFGRRRTRARRHTADKESQRWLTGLHQAASLASPTRSVVVVADREADLFDLFAAPRPEGVDLLIRAKPRRRLHRDARLLGQAAAAAPVVATMTVVLPRADDQPARPATLAVRATTVTLERPSVHPRRRLLEPVAVQVILAEQTDAPAGQTPVRWLLVTTRPALTPEAVVQAVTWYSRRWLIERLHFVLKSGCRIEALQLETAARLQRALATYLIVAWQLLWLTYQARQVPEQPWTVVLDAEQRAVLRQQYHLQPSVTPSLREAVRLIARLGGFLNRRGDAEPGVKCLWRGCHELQAMVKGYRLGLQRSSP